MRTLPLALLAAALAALPARAALLEDDFDRPDGAITTSNSPVWNVTSGSFQALNGSGYANSAVFRADSKRTDLGDVEVSLRLLNQGVSASGSAYDGFHLMLRRQSEYHMYYASVNRNRDGKIVVKKKVPGGPSNGGAYYNLSPFVDYDVPVGRWQDVRASVRNEADGSVLIEIRIDGALRVSARDSGAGGDPIRAPGGVGIRGDNLTMKADDFAVNALTAAAGDSAPLAVAVADPAAGGLVSGAVGVTAETSDDARAAGVRFELDGAPLGAEDVSAPFELEWDSTAVADGERSLVAVARDRDGALTRSAPVKVRVDNGAPAISGESASAVWAASAAVSWSSDEPADGQVEYGTSTAYGAQSELAAALSTAHAAALTELAPGTLYHYRVRSRDAAGNLALGEDRTFTTPAAGAPPILGGYALDCSTSAGSWRRLPHGSYAGGFTAEFDAVPGRAGMDGVIGLSSGAASAYDQLAAIVRFNSDGFVDARDGARYAAASAIRYAPGLTHRFRLVVDVARRRYSAYVRPQGGPEQLIGRRLAFRAAPSALNGLAHLAAAGSSQMVCALQTRSGAGASELDEEPAAAPAADPARAPQRFLSPALADGINDAAVFGAEALRVSIFDARGRRVYDGSRAAGGPPLSWNGRDGAGRLVPSGAYIARIETAGAKPVYQSLAVVK